MGQKLALLSLIPDLELYPALLTFCIFTRSFQASVGSYSQVGRYRSFLHLHKSPFTNVSSFHAPYASSRKAFGIARCWFRDPGKQPARIHRCSRFQEMRDRNFIGITPKETLRQVFVLPRFFFFY